MTQEQKLTRANDSLQMALRDIETVAKNITDELARLCLSNVAERIRRTLEETYT